MYENSRIKKALLIYPPTGLYDRFDRCQAPIESETVFMIRPPMDLAYMTAALGGAGVECKIKDYPVEKKGWADLERDLKQLSPDMLVASTVSPVFEEDCRAFEIAKRIEAGDPDPSSDQERSDEIGERGELQAPSETGVHRTDARAAALPCKLDELRRRRSPHGALFAKDSPINTLKIHL